MDIRFTGQNLKITEGMKEHLQQRLSRFEKYAPRLVQAHIFFKKEKYLLKAEVTLLAKNLHAFGEGRSKENIFAAIDEACDRVEKQLKKFRAKSKEHHKSGAKIPAKVLRAMKMMERESISSSNAPKIIHTETFAPKPMSPEEASLQLGILPENFLVFLNQNTKAVNVIYRRKDGNYGLIEPSF